jgi:hypothetical protein
MIPGEMTLCEVFMSQFSLKMDIADNRFFTGESLPLFSRAEV